MKAMLTLVAIFGLIMLGTLIGTLWFAATAAAGWPLIWGVLEAMFQHH